MSRHEEFDFDTLDEQLEAVHREILSEAEVQMKKEQAVVNIEAGRFLIIKHIQQGSRKRTVVFIDGGDDPQVATAALNKLKSEAPRGTTYFMINNQGTVL
jgi:hypothetical protein